MSLTNLKILLERIVFCVLFEYKTQSWKYFILLLVSNCVQSYSGARICFLSLLHRFRICIRIECP